MAKRASSTIIEITELCLYRANGAFYLTVVWWLFGCEIILAALKHQIVVVKFFFFGGILMLGLVPPAFGINYP